MVILSPAEYAQLAFKADIHEPKLPEPNERGNYTLQALAIITALDIIRTRRGLGLSPMELARLAGVRLETLCRIELGMSEPNVRVMTKIDKALKLAGRKKRKTRSM